MLCFVTDRHRFGTSPAEALVERVRDAARAGVHLVQVRERDLDGGPLTRVVAGCIDAVRGTRTRILVNDRLDVALVAGAHGVHLRADSFAAARARAIAPAGFLIGRSVHSADEAVAAEQEGGADYVVFGTVFPSTSKAGRAAAGLAELRTVCSATRLPVLAIGGITSERIDAVVKAGASGVAGISLFDTPARVP